VRYLTVSLSDSPFSLIERNEERERERNTAIDSKEEEVGVK